MEETEKELGSMSRYSRGIRLEAPTINGKRLNQGYSSVCGLGSIHVPREYKLDALLRRIVDDGVSVADI
jgi:hypothetical protein